MSKSITPRALRKEFLQQSMPLLKEYMEVVTGQKDAFTSSDPVTRGAVWKLLEQVILTADDPSPMTSIKDPTIAGRVDAILSQVAAGELTPLEAKKHMALVQAGFEIKELPKLLAAIDEIEE